MAKGIFITGTGTDIGKTYVTGLVVKKLRDCGDDAGYYKAALSGAVKRNGRLVPGDAEFVCDMASVGFSLPTACITVTVITSPNTPPKRYSLFTPVMAEILPFPNSHITISDSMNAVPCTYIFDS